MSDKLGADKTTQLLSEVAHELEQAQIQYPGFNSLHEGYAVILEEVDELWELVRQKQSHTIGFQGRQECIQIAAMALRMIIDRQLT